MNLRSDDLNELRAILNACRIGGVESFVLSEGLVRGTNAKRNMAIISPTSLQLPPDVKLGVGRLADLDKRLALFEAPAIELKVNQRNEVAQLTLTAGRTKAQFRCTSESLIKYPKSNDDQPLAVITISRSEAAQLSRATKTYGSEVVVVKVGREGAVHLECADSTNDQFSIDLEQAAEFQDEAEAAVFTYSAGNLVGVVDAAAKDADAVSLVIGQFGSITVLVKGHSLMVMPNVNEEE